MDPVRVALLVIAAPAAAAIATALVARGRHRGALAITAATVAGAWATLGALELWPLDVTGRIVHVIGLGLVAALVANAAPRLRRAVFALAAPIAAWLIAGPLIGVRYGGLAAVAVIGGGAAAFAAIALGLDRAADRGDRSGLLVAAIAASGAAAGAGLSGSLVIAQLGLAAAAGAGGAWLVSLARPTAALSRSAAPVIAAVVWATLALAVLYASMPIAAALIIAALPAASAAAGAAPAHARKAAVASAALLAVIAVAIAVAPARDNTPAGDDEYGYGYQ